MIGKRAEAVLNRAYKIAVESSHEYITLEHVFLSLLDEDSILDVVLSCGASPDEMTHALNEHIEKEVPKNSKIADLDHSEGDEIPEQPVATLNIQRLMQRALFQVQSAGKDEITPEDLFVSLFQAKDSFVVHLLAKQGIQRLDVINYLSHGSHHSEEIEEADYDDEVSSPVKKKKTALESYTVNLNTLVSEGEIDPLVGRKKELERLIQTLCRRRKNNPLLVGEAGVGKTAMAEGLARQIVEKKVPSVLKDAQVFSLDMGSLLAGAKFRGDFEQRLKEIFSELKALKKSGVFPVLFIDEIHTIIGAGAVSGGVLDAANLLKPMLSRGDLRCIGSTTYQEYRTIFEKDQALARRFQKIDIEEPSGEETVQIINGLIDRFEEHHGVHYLPEAIRAAVDLSRKHITDRFLPDKAIDVIDEVGARTRIQRLEKGGNEDEVTEIGPEAVEQMIARIARIPERTVSQNQKERLKNLRRDLKLSIFGQDQAIDALVTSIQLARSGLRSGEKPVGSFLFCGPTGVGKTELTKQLSHSLGVPFLRYDMSEYMEKHTVSRLIGAPPGYVGFDQAGLLTEAVRKSPHAVVLLDEIEKAHPDVWNILLQVMDHGMLTDNNGKKADFRNVTLVMTSNVGSREHEKNPIGIFKDHDVSQASKKVVEKTFTPEFRNRLDAMVFFNPLDPMTVAQVVGKQILELESQLLAKNVEIEFETEAREWLASQGYDRLMGARPMARLIQDQIKKPLSEEILFGQLEKGGSVKVKLNSDTKELEFEIKPSSQISSVPASTDSKTLTEE